VAVLPFRDLRIGGEGAHLTEGLAEEIIQELNRLEGLRVLSRTTSFPQADSGLPPSEIGRRLQVEALLTGTLQDSGDGAVLAVNLVHPASGRSLWSRTRSFDRLELFPILDDIVRQVASALGVKATPAPRRPVDFRAYEACLKGRQAYFQFSRQGMATATRSYRQALDLDPDYATAWAGLATCAAYAYIYLDRTEDQRERAESFSRKALELDPSLAEAHASRGVALSAAGRTEESEEAFETALCLDPNLYEAAYFYARHCFSAGKPERAIEYFEWAAALRPEDFQAILLVGQVYHSLGIEDEAEQARRRGLALVEQRLMRAPGDARARYLGANALVALGSREEGLRWARLARDLDPDDPMLLYNLGCIHALAGDPDEALDCLERAAAGGLSQKEWFEHDGDLDGVRDHPRFRALMASLGD
jgi:adenylate cyclase